MPRPSESCGLPGEILPARHGNIDVGRAQLDRMARAAGRPSSAPIDKTHPPGYRAGYRENNEYSPKVLRNGLPVSTSTGAPFAHSSVETRNSIQFNITTTHALRQT